MKNFVLSPHLPQKMVGLAAAGERYRARLAPAFKALGIDVIWLPDAPGADPRLAGHADLSMLHMGGDLIISSCGGEIVNNLTNRGFRVLDAPGPGKSYPEDCRLNACIVGSRFIHRLDVTAEAALENAAGLELVDCAQGYAKCCVCVVDSRSIITSDHGIAGAARKHGIDALEIRPGYIELEGFGYGFIGGASFKLSPYELAFTGRLDGHPDYNIIVDYLKARNIRPVYLSDGRAFDVGSILPLIEKQG